MKKKDSLSTASSDTSRATSSDTSRATSSDAHSVTSSGDDCNMAGINKSVEENWSSSSSYKVPFANKSEDYGKPLEGSRTEERAKQASKHVNNEVVTLISIIRGIGYVDKDGRHCVTFGRLFKYYEKISNKVVGILLRARRWHLVDFYGEILFQGQDEDVIITVLADEAAVPTVGHYTCYDTEQPPKEPPKESLKTMLKKLNNQT